MKILPLLAILVLIVGCTATTSTRQSMTNTRQSMPEPSSEEKYEKLLHKGFQALYNGNAKESIQKYFDPIIQYYEKHYQNNGKRIYSARGLEETLYYLVKAAAAKQEAIVISYLWAQAFYFKGYASIELGRIEDAKTWLKKALELSPSNSTYLSELGHIYQTEQKWSEALKIYQQAEESANAYSPDDLKNAELTRAMRGIGYSLIELGRLDEAEEKYKKCLEIDENDKKSLQEMEYIRQIRQRRSQHIEI
jgi:tetratricopeptide (TPR) repeat protein